MLGDFHQESPSVPLTRKEDQGSGRRALTSSLEALWLPQMMKTAGGQRDEGSGRGAHAAGLPVPRRVLVVGGTLGQWDGYLGPLLRWKCRTVGPLRCISQPSAAGEREVHGWPGSSVKAVPEMLGPFAIDTEFSW